MSVNVSSRTVDGVTVALLEGEITSNTATSVQERLLPLVGECDKLVVDFSGVPYVSSAGLRMLLLLYRRAQQTTTGVVLGGLSAEVRFVMSATGFLGFFEIAEDLESELGTVAP